ncbi:SAM-dependent methyltransferase [Variovorax paradoxus]|uniref:class I SAM-dependent methyltransferase n=1 Tax=Variovorax paradoxus TaxID=34073 RepID=UPI003390D14A
MNKVNFDEHAENYNELLRESVGFFSADEAYFARYKVKLVQKTTRIKPARILEYGCGIGRNIPFLRATFPEAVVEGSDVSPLSLELARAENPGVPFFLEDDGEMHELFDMVFVASVYHHIPPAQREAATATLAKRLRPGGELYIFEHNPYNPITRRIVNNCPYDADAVLLKPSETKSLVRKAAMAVTAANYCLFIPPKLSALAWIESGLGWLPLGGQYWVRGTRN